MPNVYQQYLKVLLQKAQTVMHIKTLNYESNKFSDYNIVNYGWRNRFQRLLYRLKLTAIPSLDIKRMQEFDIIHIQHSFLWKRLLPLFELKKRPKIIITLRGGDTYLKPWTFKRMAEFFQNKSEYVDAFVVMSHHQKKYLLRWGVPESKIHIIPISFGEKSFAKPKYPNKIKIELVSAFRMTWEKNIEGHLQFANELKERGVPFVYDIYGSGSDIDQLYFLVDKYKLQDHVNIKGKVENASLKALLPKYDFFVQLSISESLGMSVIEAQSFGLPCIVSNSGGLPEAVRKDKTGIVSKYIDIKLLTDASLLLWKNPNKYYAYSQNAIEHVNRNYTVGKEVERLSLLYTNLYNL